MLLLLDAKEFFWEHLEHLDRSITIDPLEIQFAVGSGTGLATLGGYTYQTC